MLEPREAARAPGLLVRARPPRGRGRPYREIRFLGESLPSLYQLDQEGRSPRQRDRLQDLLEDPRPGHEAGLDTSPRPRSSRGSSWPSRRWTSAPTSSSRHGSPNTSSPGPSTSTSSRRESSIARSATAWSRPSSGRCPAGPTSRWTEPEGGLFLWVRLPEEHRHREDVLRGDREEGRLRRGLGLLFRRSGAERDAPQLLLRESPSRSTRASVAWAETIRDELERLRI